MNCKKFDALWNIYFDFSQQSIKKKKENKVALLLLNLNSHYIGIFITYPWNNTFISKNDISMFYTNFFIVFP